MSRPRQSKAKTPKTIPIWVVLRGRKFVTAHENEHYAKWLARMKGHRAVLATITVSAGGCGKKE